MANLKNINFMSETQVDSVETLDDEELYAVDTDIAHQAMPSSRYVDLELGASATSYIAPADGFVSACLSAGNYFEIKPTKTAGQSTNKEAGGYMRLTVPVSRGEVFTIYYGATTPTVSHFRFVYAEGAY